MSRVTVIIGEPAVGKSTVLKAMLTRHGPWAFVPDVKFIPYHENERNPYARIVGRYDDMGHQFPGTDRMSMACQPHVIKLISVLPDHDFLMEGDRLGNVSFLEALMRLPGLDLAVLHLWRSEAVLSEVRRTERQDQAERFVASRRTKITNILKSCERLGIELVSIENASPETPAWLADRIWEERLS